LNAEIQNLGSNKLVNLSLGREVRRQSSLALPVIVHNYIAAKTRHLAFLISRRHIHAELNRFT
jgi:hypothetical protein